MVGGDLRYHQMQRKTFAEKETSNSDNLICLLEFIIACAMMGLEYMHTKGVIHRDIKPENMVIDDKGYVRLTDLGIASILTPNNAEDTSGTPGYMGIQCNIDNYIAPEVLCKQNHGVAVDYFALGVIAYEFMMGQVRT